MKKQRVEPWRKPGSKSVFQDFLQVCLIALCPRSGTVKCGYQFVFILCLAVSNDVKTTCQFNTKMLAGSLEIFTWHWGARNTGHWTTLSLPWIPSSHLSCNCFLCYLFASGREVAQSATCSRFSDLNYHSQSTLLQLKNETHCTWIYLLLSLWLDKDNYYSNY